MSGRGLHEASEDYLSRTSRRKRKALGQYFTPQPLCEALLDRLDLPRGASVLDPACGSGEFLRHLRRRRPDVALFGIDIDPELVSLARRLVPDAALVVGDALACPFRGRFDAVVGNPPYFERRLSPALRARFAEAISGRPQSFALFVLVGLELLRPGGRLAYVLPPSMNNGAYFRRLRRTLRARACVEWLRLVEAPDWFDGAQQTVMLFVARKGAPDPGTYWFRRGKLEILTEEPERLRALFEGASTLAELGCRVRTGRVVWNQRRSDLTDDPKGAVRLFWAHEIGAGRWKRSRVAGRPRYVRGVAAERGPAVLVNRVTGVGVRARLRAVAVPAGRRFVAENHVNVVYPPPGWGAARTRALVSGLLSERAALAVRLVTGNTQISARELEQLVPVALDAGDDVQRRDRRWGASPGKSCSSTSVVYSRPLRR